MFAAIELRYATSGRIRRAYLLDTVAEIAWIVLWSRLQAAGCRLQALGAGPSWRPRTDYGHGD